MDENWSETFINQRFDANGHEAVAEKNQSNDAGYEQANEIKVIYKRYKQYRERIMLPSPVLRNYSLIFLHINRKPPFSGNVVFFIFINCWNRGRNQKHA
jgi:hypothetical protein